MCFLFPIHTTEILRLFKGKFLYIRTRETEIFYIRETKTEIKIEFYA